jgi:hypothetical protein
VPPPTTPVVPKPSTLNVDEVGPLKIENDVYYRITTLSDALWSVETYWFYFSLGATGLTATHRKRVRQVAELLAQKDTVVEMYGRADTTGSNARNFEVAGKRLSNLQNALTMAGAPSKKVFNPANKNLGEEYAATVDDDEFPDELERVVVVYVWTDEIARGLLYNEKPFLKFARAF